MATMKIPAYIILEFKLDEEKVCKNDKYYNLVEDEKILSDMLNIELNRV